MSYVSKVIKFENNEENTVQNTKHILLCGDKNYIKYCGVTLTSILLSNPEENFTFHIFCDDISEQDIAKVEATTEKFNTNIIIYNLDLNLLKKFSTNMAGNDHISIAAYFRFIAYGELANYIDKVLYLDSDILVNGDISKFWNIDMTDKCAIVIEDAYGNDISKRVGTEKYFNSGVMFVDLKKWSKNNYTSICIRKAMEKVYQFLDQDILNIILDKNVIWLNKYYNYNYSLSRLMDKSKKPSAERLPKEVKICHFIGASKPWHSWVQCIDAVKQYNVVKEQSNWSDNLLITPFDMKGNKYKYMHKFARLAKKEGDYLTMLYWYIEYITHKILKNTTILENSNENGQCKLPPPDEQTVLKHRPTKRVYIICRI